MIVQIQRNFSFSSGIRIEVPVTLVLYRCACTHTTARAEEGEYPWRPATSQLLLEKFLDLIKYEVVYGLGDALILNPHPRVRAMD